MFRTTSSALNNFRRVWQVASSARRFGSSITHGHMRKIEEETLPDYQQLDFFPVRIGEVYKDNYRVAGKLGYGANSTVWLCEDLKSCRYVALKVFRSSQNRDPNHERQIYDAINAGDQDHPGRPYVRTLHESFDLTSPAGRSHQCLVHEPMWMSLAQLIRRNPARKLPVGLLRSTLQCLLLALYYLHTECKIIHTGTSERCAATFEKQQAVLISMQDLSANNVLISIHDRAILQEFDDAEKQNPSFCKTDGVSFVYESRKFNMPKEYGLPVLCDFGEARNGRNEHDDDIQPDVYRAPEVILEHNWSYSVDIWNLGVMVWDLFHGEHLFDGTNPDTKEYSNRYHLAEMIALMGPPPRHFLERSEIALDYFEDDYTWPESSSIPLDRDLEHLESRLQGRSKKGFLEFMHSMLKWVPEERKTARELCDDSWLAGDCDAEQEVENDNL